MHAPVANPDVPARTWRDPRTWAAVGATAGPSLLAYNVAPSPTFLNQALALALWGLFMLAGAPRAPGRGPASLWLALALLGAGVCWSWVPGVLPASFALSALGLLAAAAVVVAAGAAARRGRDGVALFVAFAWGLVVAGVLNVCVAAVQVFAPAWPDGAWLAISGIPGRAVGNLRQPNHLSSLLLWACIAAVALAELQRMPRRVALALQAAFVFGVVLTASRTGLVSVLLLAVWGVLDRRLAGRTRLVLVAAPLLYALAWVAMAQWAALSQHAFGGSQRLAEGNLSSSRFGIWANTLELIRRHPWAGVGFGEFNLAWTLTPFPGRPTAFFDHTHNLPLQFAVELGLPLATAVLTLMLLALAQSARRSWREPHPGDGTGARACVVMVVMIGLHSQLEYPLWYAYFLLPTAWAWGYALGPCGHEARPAAAPPGIAARAMTAAGLALVGAAAFAVWDYRSVADIFASPEHAPPLEQRIERGQRSMLFGHHADYAAVTSGVTPRDAGAAFGRTVHYLLDTRLMIAWSEWLARQREADRARHLAARLREFRKPDAEEFFEECPDATSSQPGAPFQCQSPERVHPWRDFLQN